MVGIKRSPGEYAFDVFITVSIGILAFLCLYPFLNITAIAFSSPAAVITGRVNMLPVEFQMESVRVVYQDVGMWRAFRFTVLLTATFTALTMIATICTAYPLAQKRLRGRNVLMFMVTFTMFFNGGLIPTYLLVRGIGLIDSMWALILPGLVATWNMIIMRSFFLNLPAELEESARIDGANDILILIRIILPVSTPVLAAISLFYAVGRWNGFQDAVFFINDATKYPLQLVLNQIVMRGQTDQMMTELVDEEQSAVVPETIKAATLLFVTIPIILVYPWLQKYFVKGIMLGSIKG